ncbi:MAG: cell wall hydrolase [Asticcacaulis sp.]|uniref:cell wall hydrolase n=1 Tax=Asticcacaulis sp. TaxID=1872648 RepID=UPI0039E5E36E
MAAGSVGLLAGASIGAASLGSHLAREGSAPKDAARLMMASREGKVDMEALDAAGTVDQSALNIAMRFSQYAGTGTDNSLLAQNLTNIRTSEDAREQRGLPEVKVVLASNIAPASPLSAPAPSIRAAAAVRFAGANRSDSDCLTQAVYYEARGEGDDGMRAVAQVILNRVRHPAYPKTICGVVYQGAYQRTSCQFSFVCNGAMGAPVESWAWRRAKKVADAALNGYVMTSVGTSTSFHTTGVQPGWGSTMERVAQVGSHIFYQFRGRGSRIANTLDGVRPSDVPMAPAEAPKANTAAETQTVAMLNAQSLNNSAKAQADATQKPVQVSAQIHGKSAQDIIAEVSTPAKATASEAVKASPPIPAKGITQ